MDIRILATLAMSVALLAAPLGAAATFELPPASEGIINGKQALLVWPVDDGGTLLDPARCEVHLVPDDELDRELTYPCGRWFLPPRKARYDFWVEQDNGISASQTMLDYAGTSFRGAGFRSTEVLAPAGFVTLGGMQLQNGQSFRILSLTSPGLGFEQRLIASAAMSRVRFPAGRVLGGVFGAEGEAIALSRPVSVGASQTVQVTPVAPLAGAADVLVVFRKPGKSLTAGQIKLQLQYPRGRRAPDVMHETQSRVFAVWYGIPPGIATVTVSSKSAAYDSEPVTLTANRVTTIRAMLRSVSE